MKKIVIGLVAIAAFVIHVRLPAQPTKSTGSARILLAAVANAAICGNGIVEAGEDCDPGGTCIGNAKAGQACTSDADCCATADCSSPQDGGVCDAGAQLGTACSTDADCPDSRCVRCKTFGGSGCAANCTTESDFVFNLVPGQVDPNTGVTLLGGTSGAVVHGQVLTLPLPIGNVCEGGSAPGAPCVLNSDCGIGGVCTPATQTFRVGRDRGDGIIPLVVKAASVKFPRIDIGGLACGCVRGVAQKTCGGTIFDADGVTQTTFCTENFGACDSTNHCANAAMVSCAANTDCEGDALCSAADLLPCTLVHGAGNSATGLAGCSASGLPAVDVNESQDAGGCGNPPTCTTRTPNPPVITLATMGPPGSAIVLNTTAIGTAVGPCTGADPSVYGPDGVICTDDDPQASRGTPQTIFLTTGQACAAVTNVNFSEPPANISGICQGSPGAVCSVDADCATLGPCVPICATGAPFSCSALSSGDFPGGALAGSFVSLGQPTIGDVVVTQQLFPQSGAPAPTPTPTTPPPNDDFANATVIDALPFTDTVDTTGATRETGEPTAPCDFGPLSGTVWYAFTPPESESISASANGSFFSAMVAVYTGNSLASLTELGCQPFGGLLTFDASAGTTYYFQVAGLFGQGGPLQFQLTVPPPPVASFGFFPSDPSIFDTIQFFDGSFDPAGAGFQSYTWDFGDGTAATGSFTTHQYAADGDYTVQHGVTTVDGRTASTSQIVHVQTHDVAITKFLTPNAAKAGQTRSISVGVSSKRNPETVEVDLFKSTPGGFVQVGFLTQSVPVRPSNRTTDFDFSYTFTSADASIGKVTFRAVATLIGARDALPADNEAISSPTKVSR